MTTYDEFRAQYPDGEIPTHLLSAYDEARTTWALDLADTAEAAAAEAATAPTPARRTHAAETPSPHPAPLLPRPDVGLWPCPPSTPPRRVPLPRDVTAMQR